MVNIIVKMELDDKNCKNVYRYKEIGNDKTAPILNYLYVRKYAFEGKPPKNIEVAVWKEKKGE